MKKLFSRAKKETDKNDLESEYDWDGMGEGPADGAEDLLRSDESRRKDKEEYCVLEDWAPDSGYYEEAECPTASVEDGEASGAYIEYVEDGEWVEPSAENAEQEPEYYQEPEASEEYLEGDMENCGEPEFPAEYAEGFEGYYEASEPPADTVESEAEYCGEWEFSAGRIEGAEYAKEAESQEGQGAFSEYIGDAEFCEGPEYFEDYAEEAESQEEPGAFGDYVQEADYLEEPQTFEEYAQEAEYQEEPEPFEEYAEEAEYQEEAELFEEYAQEAQHHGAQELPGEYFGEDGPYYETGDSAEMFGGDGEIYEPQENAERSVGEAAEYYESEAYESEALFEEYEEESAGDSVEGQPYREQTAYEEDEAYLDVPLRERAVHQAGRNTRRESDSRTAGRDESRRTARSAESADRRMERSAEESGRRTARSAEGADRRSTRDAESRSGNGISGMIGQFFHNMDILDKVMLASGAAVVILVIVTVNIFIKAHAERNQMAVFANVGVQLEGIQMIGEKGILAVANAETARLAALVTPTAPPDSTDPNKDYGEIGYSRQVSVEPSFTSIQKDLKIKFINKKSDKLVPNVPFSVTVTAPDGGTYIWSDDDMDGIIYKKDIVPGNYQVAMELLADTRYSDYTVSTSTRSVEVKKEIVYEKVDVANEVKKEAEINVAKEDTKKNETVVESSLQDTVGWVESKVIAATYNEVAKSSIPDPLTIVKGEALSAGQAELSARVESSALQVLSEVMTQPLPPQTSAETSTEAAIQSHAEIPTEVPAQVPTEAPAEVPTEAPAQVPTEAPSQAPTEAPTPVPTPVPVRGTVTVEQTALSGGTGGSLKTKASAGGFSENARIVYSIRTNNPAVATASIDTEGNIEVYAVAVGTAVLTVTANYEGGTAETQAAADITVTVGGIMSLTLDTTSLATHVQESVVVNASIFNMISQDPVVTAESSNTNIAAVSVDKRTVTVSGVSEGIADITVKYTENGTEVSASCKVTVKKNPKQDIKTPLKDADGRQLYVMEGSAYREAVYADYYIAQKFFVKGEAKYTGWQTLDGNVYYFASDGSKVTGEQVIQGAKYNFASDGALVTGDGELGIDVSKWNGTIDWNAVKNSGVSYVIIRCGYRGSSAGKLIEDPKFEANIKGAAAAGLKIGVYFFTQAVNEIEAVEEASMVLEQIKDYKISYPVFLDVEASGGRGDAIDKETRTAVCKAFCQTIQKAGYNAGIYSGRLWLEEKINAADLNMYKIWLAQYAAAPTYTGRYDMWQYKATGSISGVSGDVDLNISYLGY